MGSAAHAAWLASVIVGVCVSCAGSYGTAEEPPSTDAGADATARTDGAPDSSGSSGDSSLADADAADDGPPAPCTKVPLGGVCNASGDCCSQQCSAANTCTAACGALYSSCAFDVCCLGSHCTGGPVPFCTAGP